MRSLPMPQPAPPRASAPSSRPPDRHGAAMALLAALGLLLLAGPHGVLASCGPGLLTPGVTIPQGDIILQEGDLLELYCVLDLDHPATKGRNASHLAFYRQNKTIGPEHLQVLNETTLKLSLRPDVSSNMYYCKLNQWGDAEEEVVCLNNVAVGYPPQDVTDFHCVSQNWQNLTCSWKKMPNPVKTRYTIWFRVGGGKSRGQKFGCPDETDIHEERCVWSEASNPPYRQPYDSYLFSLEGVNHFNKSVFYHKFSHFAHVIPGKPENLKVKEKTAYSALLEWSLPYPLQNFPPGLIQRVEYLPQWESRESWHRVNTSHLNPKQSKHELNITLLKYANTLYDIRVYMRSKNSPKDEREADTLWSAPAAVTVKTKPDLPGAPPRTDIGSFEVFNHVDSRDVYVYWQTIPDYLQNGDKFSYKIIDFDEEGNNIPKEPTELNKKYAKFSKVELNKTLRLSIVSVNTEGQSVNKSEIRIPGRLQVPPGPASVTKVFYENGTYELSWKPPITEEEKIESYTIFWCDSIYDHMCSGYLNWTHVSSNITIKNMTVEDDKPYQFAVSANTHNSSSGMVWASCTILYNKPIQKMKNVWVKRVGSTFMELVWNLDCLDRNGLVDGFRIYYCPVQHKGPECKSPNQNITVWNPQESYANLTGLRPYTTYSISIAVLSSAGESLPSDPLYNVTLEAAPSPPQHVTIVDITNTTITISWNAPEEKNGVITKYEVHYDGKVQTKNNDQNKEHKVVLNNLTSYYNYSISVAACTFACSDKSPPLIAETKVGEPGMVNAPHVSFLNQSLLLVNWDPPVRPSGLLDYYEVNIAHPDGENSTIEKTYEPSFSKQIEGCSESQNQPYSFFVRAVNVDPITGRKFKGPWSKPGEGSCYTNDLPQYLKIIIYALTVSIILLISFCLICLGKRAWYKCKDMRDVEVKLPPGIVLPLETGRDQDFKMHQWVNHNHDSKPPHGLCPAADEERLLQQKDDHHHDRNLSGDSSGCSSGHESVASSATSGTRISSDSGTEVDRNEPPWDAGSDSGSVGRRQDNKCSWDEPYACVGAGGGGGGGAGGNGGKGVRSTPNLTELDPGYAVLSLASWPSSSSIPDRPEKPKQPLPLPPPQPTQSQSPSRGIPVGYVSLDAASALGPPQLGLGMPPVPQDRGKQGYVAHPPSSLLWDRPESQIPRGYVQTGTGVKECAAIPAAFTPECEGSWEQPFGHRLQPPPQQQPLQGHGGQALPNSAGYVKAGECGVRPSRTEPALGSGYVMTSDSAMGLLRDRHKPNQAPAKQAHEYVLTGEREVSAGRGPPLVQLDAEPPKAYCRVSERDVDVLVRPLTSSGYVPHAVPVPHAASSSRVIE